MLELLNKKELTKEELEKLDKYFYDNHIDELLIVDNQNIIKFIELSEKELDISFTKIELKLYLESLIFEYKVFFNEEEINLYIKILELIDYFDFNDAGLAYVLGDYYFNDNRMTEALNYYKMIFKEGFDLSNEGYFYSLSRYLELLCNTECDVLKNLINASPKKDYSIEFVDTYLLLLNYLDKTSPSYLKYIDEAISITTPLVREYQKHLINDMISDSDIERNLCELLSLKMEYNVLNKNYVKAYDIFKELTNEIIKSGCLRYYHVRDLLYYQMLKLMSEEYLELKFFDNISNKTFKIISKIDDLKVDQEIVLEDDNGKTFKFVIINIRNNVDVVIAPILPLLGVGCLIFTTLIINNNYKYLKNTF